MKTGLMWLCAALAQFVLSGCYSERWTGIYDEVYDVEDPRLDSAVIEETGRTQAEQEERRKILSAIAAEKDPVYLMNSGDGIDIRVYGNEELNMPAKIGPDGTIGFPFIGQLQLSGLSIGEAADKIREGLMPYIKNPVVSVSVTDIQSDTATIAGSCMKPGVYDISNFTRLADLYAMAGSSASRLFNGANVDVADLEHSFFFRDGKIVPIDFRAAIEHGDPLENVKLRKGDYIFIAQRMEAAVTICGDIKNPHKRLYEPDMNLLETLTAAGWLNETHWSHVIIIRDSVSNPKMYKVDVDGILAGKRRNVRLYAGDIIYVPKDNLSEYNVFVRKLLPSAQLFNMVTRRLTKDALLD